MKELIGKTIHKIISDAIDNCKYLIFYTDQGDICYKAENEITDYIYESNFDPMDLNCIIGSEITQVAVTEMEYENIITHSCIDDAEENYKINISTKYATATIYFYSENAEYNLCKLPDITSGDWVKLAGDGSQESCYSFNEILSKIDKLSLAKDKILKLEEEIEQLKFKNKQLLIN